MDTGNRVLWTLVAAVLVAVGGLGVAAGVGALPRVDRDAALLPDGFLPQWRGWGDRAWTGTIVAGVLLVLLGTLLVRAELRGRGGRSMPDLTADDLPIPAAAAPVLATPGVNGVSGVNGVGGSVLGARSADGAEGAHEAQGVDGAFDGVRVPGSVRVRAGAIVNGVEHDLARHPAVRRATVTLAGDAPTPRVLARLDVRVGTELADLRHHVSTTMERLTATTGLRPDAVDVTVRLTEAGGPRVR